MAKKKESHALDPNHWEAVLSREFANESDRASVILSAALLDSALESLIRARLLPSPSADDPLLDGSNAPLGTFSARIEMCFRLGLIDGSFARALHLIRKIRNDFAHNITGCTFVDGAVANRLTELVRSTRLIERNPEIRPQFPLGARGDFQYVVSFLQYMMRSKIEHTSALSDSNSLVGYWLLPDDNVDDAAKKKASQPPG